MSRNLINMLLAAVVLNAAVVVLTTLWTDTANSTTSPAGVSRSEFDYVFAAVTTTPNHNSAPANVTVVDFDQAFASVSIRRREDTPPNRERLRNIGWKRILGPN